MPKFTTTDQNSAVSGVNGNGRSNTKISTTRRSSVSKSTDTTLANNPNTSGLVNDYYEYTKSFNDVTSYRLMRGVPDFGQLVQFNPYETGYAAFIICQMPEFIERLVKKNQSYEKLVRNWAHIVEYEFKSFEGLEDMSAEVITLGDDLNSLNVISKVNMQSASEFSLTYDEKSGSPLTKFAKLYLSGIKDPRTQVKSYHGLIHSGIMEPGFEHEVFTFLFIATDNTMRKVESAYLLIGCQLNSADTSMYNYTKGDIQKKEVTVKFSGYPVQSRYIDMAAQDILSFLLSTDAGARQIIINSNDFNYSGTDIITKTLTNYGVSDSDKSKYPSFSASDNTQTYSNSTPMYISDDTNGDGNPINTTNP